jgi:hypothetical protein
MAATIKVAGTVQLTKTESRSVITLWDTTYNDKLQKDIKTAYKVWTDVPGDWTEGTWIEITGTLSVRPSINMDGTPRTYVDSKGNTITAHDLNINDVTILNAKIKDNAGATGRDLDDEAKYGGTYGHLKVDDSPF